MHNDILDVFMNIYIKDDINEIRSLISDYLNRYDMRIGEGAFGEGLSIIGTVAAYRNLYKDIKEFLERY